MTKLIIGAGAVSIASLFATSAVAECGDVSITEMDWASASVVTNVAKFLMTEGYGCNVTVVPSATLPALASLAETGEPDILTEVWSTAVPAYDKLKDEGKLVELNLVLSDGGVEGYWIPGYLAQEYPELKTIEGVLANPEKVGGRFHDCPAGWACGVINNNNLKALNIEKHGLERFQHGSGETLAASIASAFEAKEPWFGYYWAPTSILGKYPMVQVDLGVEFNQEHHSCNSEENCENPQVSIYPTAKVVTAIAAPLKEREPEVVELMSKISFTNAQMGSVLAWKDDNNASSEEAAVFFLSSHPEVWGDWLSEDARAKLSALLN